MSNPKDDERRKFEAWAKTSPECDGWWSQGGDFTYAHDQYINDDEIESAWRAWLARAEQAETPIDIPFSDAPCGHPGQYCWTEDGGKHIVCLLCELKRLNAAFESLGFEIPSNDAAAPVEDRPAPTPCKCGQGDCPTHDDDKQSVIYEESDVAPEKE